MNHQQKPQEKLLIKEAAQRLLSQSSSTQSQIAPKSIQRALLLHDETYATVLLLLVIDVYGPEVFPSKEHEGWTPETIKLQLEHDFGLKLPKDNLDKIMAAISIITTNYFWKDVSKFIELCNILSGDDFQPDEFDPADAGEILWGVTEASLLWPPDDDPEDTEFSAEIIAYIQEVLHVEGISNPPDLLRLGMSGLAGQEIDETFADDPEMFNAVWDAQQSKTDELQAMVQGNLTELQTQLNVLPLNSGDKQQFMEQLQKLTAATSSESNGLEKGLF